MLMYWPHVVAANRSHAGREWMRRAMAAFTELALGESNRPVLTSEQTILRDLIRAVDAIRESAPEDLVEVFGADLRDEIRRLDDPVYTALSDRALAMRIAEMLPARAHVIERDGRRSRGFYVAEIEGEWERRKPPPVDEDDLVGELDPFDILDDPSGTTSAPPTQPDGTPGLVSTTTQPAQPPTPVPRARQEDEPISA